MERCQTIEDGVRAVLKIYNITEPDWELIPGDLCDTLRIGAKTVPLFWWRVDTQVAQMIDLAPPRKLCSMKLNRTCTKAEGLDRLLYRELDIAEACLGAPVSQVMCYKREHSLMMLATMANERVAIFELAAVLHEDTPEQGRHTYWGQDGMAGDRVVSQKVPSEAVYLFTDDEGKAETYNDIFLYTYGLNKTDATKAAAIAEILMGWREVSDWTEKDAHYRSCIKAAWRSAESGQRVEVAK